MGDLGGFGWVDAGTAFMAFVDWLVLHGWPLAMASGLLAGLAAQYWMTKLASPCGSILVDSHWAKMATQLISGIFCTAMTLLMVESSSPPSIGFAVLWGAASPLTYSAFMAFVRWKFPEIIERWEK